MKVIISGPKRMPNRNRPDDPWPHMHVELDMPSVPAEGERITLNSGYTVRVRRRFWYVQGPENAEWFDLDARYDTDRAKAEVVYLDVLPSDYDEPFTYDKAITEGIERGREDLAAEIEKMIGLTDQVDPASVLTVVHRMVHDEAAKARKRAEEAEQHKALAAQILAELRAEREGTS
jgi:hypothetical protein